MAADDRLQAAPVELWCPRRFRRRPRCWAEAPFRATMVVDRKCRETPV